MGRVNRVLQARGTDGSIEAWIAGEGTAGLPADGCVAVGCDRSIQ